MIRQKKWHEYSRPIPNDNEQRAILMEKICSENKSRTKWQNTYGRMIKLYRETNQMNYGFGCEKEVSPDDKSTLDCSMVPGPPTAMEYREDSGLPEYSCGSGLPPPVQSHNPEEEEDPCYCKPRFRKLMEFPPRCVHVCARMGFQCWMCDPRANELE